MITTDTCVLRTKTCDNIRHSHTPGNRRVAIAQNGPTCPWCGTGDQPGAYQICTLSLLRNCDGSHPACSTCDDTRKGDCPLCQGNGVLDDDTECPQCETTGDGPCPSCR